MPHIIVSSSDTIRHVPHHPLFVYRCGEAKTPGETETLESTKNASWPLDEYGQGMIMYIQR